MTAKLALSQAQDLFPPPRIAAATAARLAEPHDPSGAGALEESLRQLAWSFGLQGGYYVHIGHAIRDCWDERAPNPARFVATSVSDRRLYLDERGLASDPAARRIANAHTPFAWSAAAEDNADDGRRWLAGRLKGRGVYGGLAAPVQDYAAGPAYISLYSAYIGEADRLVASRGPELAYAAAAFHEKAKAKLASATPNGVGMTLTAREMDCLRLAALGLTVTETGEALQVTPRTVEFHLKNAAEKFGAPNKIRAVALAISQGLITA